LEKAVVLATLDSLGVEGFCPVCGAKVWTGIGPEGAELPVKLVVVTDGQTPSSDSLPPGIRCAALICGRCGFVRLHSEGVLGKAMESGTSFSPLPPGPSADGVDDEYQFDFGG
jgi:hypothetical protein